MMAHILDGDRAQNAIQKQIKQAATMGAANQYGFNLDLTAGDRYSQVLGEEYNSFGDDQRRALEASYAKLGVTAANDERLASIDKDSAFTRTDVLDAELLNDNDKKSASQRRGEREKNRFSGSSGFARGNGLSRGSGI